MNWLALDFETTGRNKYSCDFVGVGLLGFDPDLSEQTARGGWFTDLDRVPKRITQPVVMHNASYDLHLCKRWGIRIEGPVHDTYLMAKHVRNDLPSYSLKSLSWYYFNDTYQELLAVKQYLREHGQVLDEEQDENFDLSKVPEGLVRPYCMKDVEMTARLAQLLWPKLRDSLAYEEDRKFLHIDEEMEEWGICADLDFYRDYQRRGVRRVRYNRHMAQVRMGTEQNPMGDALREHLVKLGEKRLTAKKKVRSDIVTLREWKKKDTAIGSVLRVRATEKNVNTYATNILKASVPIPKHPQYGIFHPNLMQSSAITRRYRASGFLSDDGTMTKGNTQNFSDDMKEGIVARPGYAFYKMDLASIEARMFSSYLSLLMGEDHFARLYRADPWFNVYLHVLEVCAGVKGATKKHELYTPYKHGTLGRLYGSSANRFTIQLRDDFNLNYSVKQVEEIYRNIDRNFPFIRAFQMMVSKLINSKGFIVDPFGAVYYVNANKAYMGVAYLCQGSAGMVLKWWGNRMRPLLQEADDHISNTVHDEFDLEVRRNGVRRMGARVQGYADLLEELDIFDLPLKAEIKGPVDNWLLAG